MSQTALLLNPPFSRTVFRDHYCSSEAKAAYLWHPLDLQIQAAWLVEAGYQVHAADAIALGWGLDDLRLWAKRYRAQVAVVLVSERTWAQDKRALEVLRQEGVELVVASGDFLRFGDPPAAEALGAVDLVLTDFTTPHLADSLRARAPAGPGVTTVDEVIAGRFHDLGRALLDYPTPDPHLFAPAQYRLPYPGFNHFASVLTTYGCPHHCRYCHVGELGARLRPEADILEELRAVRAAGFGQIYFRDATLNANRAHLMAWTGQMIQRGLSLPWASFATARPMDAALAERLYASGCRHLQIGVETLADGLRDANGKPFDGDAHRAFVEVCHAAGIEVTAHLVLGLAGETEQTLGETVRGIASARFDYVAVNLAEDRAGVPWRQEGTRLPIAPTGGAAPGATGPSPARLRAAQQQAYRNFYLRPGRLAREAFARVAHRDFADLVALAGSVAGWRGA